MTATFLNTLPNFLLYLGVAGLLLVAFLYAYSHLTPQSEFHGIRAGNLAPALSLMGAALGFAIPLASVISHSMGIIDVLVWGIVALLVQLATFYLSRLAVPNVCRKIDENCTAAGVYLGGMGVVVGVLQASCMTY